MAALVLTTVQAQFLTSMEATTAAVFEDGVIVPGGNPPVLEGFEGYKDYTLEQKSLGVNALKSTFTPFLVSLSAVPVYTTVSAFTNGFGVWGDSRYGEGVVRYTRDLFGYVRIHGLMRTPVEGPTIGLIAFTLPAGYRPGPNDRSIHACVANNDFCSVEVDDAGLVSLRSNPPNDTWVSLEIRFFAGG